VDVGVWGGGVSLMGSAVPHGVLFHLSKS
jgi:hypothetical protein